MRRTIENPSMFSRVLDPIKGIKREDREFAELVEKQNRGQGKIVLEALGKINRHVRNPFSK